MRRDRGSVRKWVAPTLLGAAAILAVTGSGTDAQETPLNLTVEGAEAGGIAGAVSGAEGMAVPDARLTFFVEGEESAPALVGRTFTDVFGRYDFELPGSGCYSVVVETPAGVPTAEISSLQGGFCVGDAGQSVADVDLS